ncbi:unnamed protein product [Miscanthus lutarioriparius]|uniref:Glycosyltransferase family 28 N-terminal domain-containing protein n=1 Tax=Miscanthus lutarioriparius TaxID=422564 RepID=A0A811NQH4_9POAL|nr:unnamed protein product [Miscanthus lutarioriparius]
MKEASSSRVGGAGAGAEDVGSSSAVFYEAILSALVLGLGSDGVAVWHCRVQVSNNCFPQDEGISSSEMDNTECSETPSEMSGSERTRPEDSKKHLPYLIRRYLLKRRPPMQIAMLIVGTRGDVQPFIAIGKCLQDYGHRVRLATHANFKDFVMTTGLEFYPLVRDPKILAGYMVKNKGFLPAIPSEIPIQRKQIRDIIFSLLPACKDPDIDTGVSFSADAIIANPAAYGLPVNFRILSHVKQPAGYRVS